MYRIKNLILNDKYPIQEQGRLRNSFEFEEVVSRITVHASIARPKENETHGSLAAQNTCYEPLSTSDVSLGRELEFQSQESGSDVEFDSNEQIEPILPNPNLQTEYVCYVRF